MKIGIFDSGVGGLTVLNTAFKIIPCADYVFYADLDNVPYGIKSKEEINNLTYKSINLLNDLGVDAIVLACNTATSAAAENLRKMFDVPIIGMEPAIKPAVETTSGKKILVMATELTLKEEKFKKLVNRLDADDIVDLLPMPELVEAAEKFEFESKEVENLLISKLNGFNLLEYEALVLGCTHYIYFKKMLRRIVPSNMSIIDGNEGTILNLLSTLNKKKITSSNINTVEFYISGRKSDGIIFNKFMKYLKTNNI